MRKFLIYAAIWIAAAASLEIGTRLFFKREPALLYANNVLTNFSAELGWFHNPNTVYRYRTRFGNTVTYRINAQGFRGPELTRDPMIKTIGVFGDSYSFGQGVDDQFAFPALLGRNLEQKHVLNTGVYGYRPSQSFHTYERVSEKWPLETVIIQLCYNHFGNQEGPIVRSAHKGCLNPSPPTTAWGEFKNLLLLHSEIASRLRVIFYRSKGTSVPRPDYMAPDFEVRRQVDLGTTKSVLAQWISMARSKGQNVIVIYIPHEWQIDPDATPHAPRWKTAEGGVDPDAAHRWLAPFMLQFPEAKFIDFAPHISGSL